MKKLLNEIFIKRIYYSLAYLAFIPVSIFVLALASIVCLFIGEDKVSKIYCNMIGEKNIDN